MTTSTSHLDPGGPGLDTPDSPSRARTSAVEATPDALSLTLADVVHSDPTGAEAEVAEVRAACHEALRESALPPMTSRSVDDQAVAVIDGLLKRDVLEVFAAGWRSSRRLVEAARETAETPGLSIVVEIKKQTISETLSPTVDLLVNQVQAARLEVTVTTTATLQCLAAVIERGALVGFDLGSCEVAVTLGIAGADPISRSRTIESAQHFRLTREIVLCRPERGQIATSEVAG